MSTALNKNYGTKKKVNLTHQCDDHHKPTAQLDDFCIRIEQLLVNMDTWPWKMGSNGAVSSMALATGSNHVLQVEALQSDV
jgi:hypothetical protein